ncbi:MAG TPA: PilZ domain-containing protein [Candidatus Acidoferrales bacterium]|nr:PilZ domain-containing protein [Candidatus Acidoferrales bacterium]
MSTSNNNDFKMSSTTRGSARLATLRELSVTYEGRSEDVALRPPDISTHGMFINTNRRFPEGAVLNVQFRLGQSGAHVSTRAEVRYCLAGVGVGIEFIDISAEAVQAIEREVTLQQTM